ncbi:uncharacterized protein [Amphiura filiformis]|uniref:uncharacterized protein n=1 Tax=Amphiura filiformis TaxID=82378 RepID=UPI003B225ED2
MSRLHIIIFVTCVVYGTHAAPILQIWKRDNTIESKMKIRDIIDNASSGQIQTETGKENSRAIPEQQEDQDTENVRADNDDTFDGPNNIPNKSQLPVNTLTNEESNGIIDTDRQKLPENTGDENAPDGDTKESSSDGSAFLSSVSFYLSKAWNSSSDYGGLQSWRKPSLDYYFRTSTMTDEGDSAYTADYDGSWTSFEELTTNDDDKDATDFQAEDHDYDGSPRISQDAPPKSDMSDGQHLSTSNVGYFDGTLLLYGIPTLIGIIIVYKIWKNRSKKTVKVLMKITDSDNSKWDDDYQGKELEPMLNDEDSDS